MGARPPIVLLSRPRPASERVATALARAATAPHEVLVAPVVEIIGRGAVPPLAGVAGLILTSENAVQRLAEVPAGIAAYCVGDRTAAAAAERGCRAVSAGGDAEALLALLLHDRPPGRLLHLRGESARGDLVTRLSAAGLNAESAVVYASEPRALGDDAARRLAGASRVVAPVYSPGSAAALAATWPQRAPAPVLVAISPAAAAAWTGPQAQTIVACDPDGDSMIDAIVGAL